MAFEKQPMPIAVVGMSCRLPGDVSTPSEFYRMLCRARTGWCPIPEDRFNAEAYHHPNPDKKGCINSQGGYFIKHDLSQFDAGFFDITKKEAESMDPAQRLLMECAYEALENGGIPKESISGKKVGVFIGANYNEHRTGNFRDLDNIPSFDATGNQGAFLSGRIAYYFNLRGPTFTVDTACSSSMHAVHLAVQSIRSGESEQALVGASHLITQPDVWVSMAKLRLFGDSGRTFAFDHRAKSGYARGEGAACLMLKPLSQAQSDNDHIYGVIHHTGISHNGRTVGIVAPSPEEQEQLLRDVFAQAKVDPKDVGFFEAHGTGTKKGDPIEATAIYKAVGNHFTPKDPLYIGSSKPNVGHLECASGIVSIIKGVLMLYYGFILPNADFEKENEFIPFNKWNMRVATKQLPWPSKRKYVCVNNFGFSGSNSTCILRAAPITRQIELGADGAYTTPRLFVISANDETALKASMSKLGIWLEQHAELYQTTMPRNLSYTLCQRRSHLPWRVAIVESMCSGLAGALNGHDIIPSRSSSEQPKISFVFTGQGAQWWGMGRELLKTHPVFADAIYHADATLREIGADFSILEELTRDKKTTKVGMAHISQPICSAVQLALVDLLASFGIRPTAVTGHSSGEIGAAYAAGALDFESAMSAAYFRGQMIIALKEEHPDLKGSMMAIGAGAADLGTTLDEANKKSGATVVVACENSPSSTTLSGDEKAIDCVAETFQAKGVFNRKLFVDVAYHSPHMKLISDKYLAAIKHLQPPANNNASITITSPASAFQKGPEVEFFSSLRARKIPLSELTPQYWVDNLTQSVRFASSLAKLCTEHQPDILIEVGPHAALKGPIMQTLKTLPSGAGSKIAYMPTLTRDIDATKTLLTLCGSLWQRGYVGLDFFNINHNREERETPDLVSGLYSYPWSRQSYWTESRLTRQHRLKEFPRHDLLGVLADWSNNELEPVWRNMIRSSDLTWLKDYTVPGASADSKRSVFPVSGWLSAVVEASNQRYQLLNQRDRERANVGVKISTGTKQQQQAERFEITNVQVKEQLFVEDEEQYEVIYTLRAVDGQEGLDEFRICSFEESRGWVEHCTGFVRASAAAQGGARQQQSNGARVGGCTEHSHISARANGGSNSAGESEKVYKELESMGVTYPSAFQTVVEASANENEVAAHCQARNTVTDMPLDHETEYKIHPSVFDALLQLPLLSLNARNNNSEAENTCYLPSAIRHVSIRSKWSKNVGESFCVHSTAEPRSGTFMVEAFASPGSDAASISVAGLELQAIQQEASEAAEPRELCFQINWEAVTETAQANGEANGDAKSTDKKKSIVIISEDANPDNDALISALSRKIKDATGSGAQTSKLSQIKDWKNSIFVMLSELDRPAMLPNLKTADLEQVKKLLTSAPGCLWVTRGATRFPTNPDAAMALGLVRTARSEKNAVAATLDLDPNTKIDSNAQAALIHHAMMRSVLAGESEDDMDMEFAEENGHLVVPRLAPDENLNLDVHRELGPSAAYLQNFHQAGRQLQVAGVLASSPKSQSNGNGPNKAEQQQQTTQEAASPFQNLYFADREDIGLGEDEVEIQVAASALTQDDASQILNGSNNTQKSVSSTRARGVAGTISRIGSGVRNFAIGTKVAALSSDAFGTHARARSSAVIQMPGSVSIQQAACIPTTVSGAYYALTEIARLRPGERLLVQLNGPVGVAAVEVARYLGAETYVLVGSDFEQDAARRLKFEPERIFDARSVYFRRQLEDATNGKDMEVILTVATTSQSSINSQAKAAECLADFGRLVEVRLSDESGTKHQKSSVAAGLPANATFVSVNIASLAAARPQAMAAALKTVMEKLEQGVMQPPMQATVIPVRELANGLDLANAGAVHPIVCVAAGKGGSDEMVKATHRHSKSIFRRDGTHLIVGGTGGLGRSMAKYMVEHGARTVVLLSRSGGSQAMADKLTKEVGNKEARILIKKCDASDEAQVRQLIKECAKDKLPPICGIIHSAMVLRDVLLERMSHSDYIQVITPKVRGGWNMHNVLAESKINVDYFVVLSSASGILGSRGQAAYAAANTFLDSFVQFRRSKQLPGTSLDLTAVIGAGYLADNAAREEDIIRNFGNETVSEMEVLALLGAAVRGTAPAQTLTGLKLHVAADSSFPYYAESDARFTLLKKAALAEAHAAGLTTKSSASPGTAFRAAGSPEEAKKIAADGILNKLSEVLTIRVEDLDVARNITSYGLDSLTAIELRNWIAKELRANLQILELLSSGTVVDLAGLIVQKVRG